MAGGGREEGKEGCRVEEGGDGADGDWGGGWGGGVAGVVLDAAAEGDGFEGEVPTGRGEGYVA